MPFIIHNLKGTLGIRVSLFSRPLSGVMKPLWSHQPPPGGGTLHSKKKILAAVKNPQFLFNESLTRKISASVFNTFLSIIIPQWSQLLEMTFFESMIFPFFVVTFNPFEKIFSSNGIIEPQIYGEQIVNIF